MDTPIDYLCRIKAILDQAKVEYTDNSKRLSLLDLETQNILHMIENESFDAAHGYHFAKQLKEIRLKRRIVKNNHELLQILISGLDFESLDKIDRKLQRKLQQHSECVYIPRVLKAN